MFAATTRSVRLAIVEAVLEQTRIDQSGLIRGCVSRVNKVFRRVLGCWHRHMSLPFTRGNETYRTCVDCGARRRFDLDQWTMVGAFYRSETHQEEKQ
jgi:hypothetical protein